MFPPYSKYWPTLLGQTSIEPRSCGVLSWDFRVSVPTGPVTPWCDASGCRSLPRARELHAFKHVRVDKDADKDKGRPEPLAWSKRLAKVHDAEDDAARLSKREDHLEGHGRYDGRQAVHRPNAHVVGHEVDGDEGDECRQDWTGCIVVEKSGPCRPRRAHVLTVAKCNQQKRIRVHEEHALFRGVGLAWSGMHVHHEILEMAEDGADNKTHKKQRDAEAPVAHKCQGRLQDWKAADQATGLVGAKRRAIASTM
ncbi:hypothetical protein H310_00022 [Aphanomyces invadans]|uniref:Uncharacterized protein n=1 Tax=Aphanomyces invadans TaxID=157072 RepID=A0A024UUX1_9STRA|nr:hypothetical protein H310_00022 [Aphanomyces invadans]ETW09413.1 hypothetical protein H310_00022 [Aphanomyces invadans]|eukprot:XP_008860824.1 hypothetical protein H310_00022 [Aphanomyces invadans]